MFYKTVINILFFLQQKKVLKKDKVEKKINHLFK